MVSSGVRMEGLLEATVRSMSGEGGGWKMEGFFLRGYLRRWVSLYILEESFPCHKWARESQGWDKVQ